MVRCKAIIVGLTAFVSVACFADNLKVCLDGRYPALCNRGQLSSSQVKATEVAEAKANLQVCMTGKYPTLCNRALLSDNESHRVEAAERRENLSVCLSGKYPTLCNHALLSEDERKRVIQSERRENLNVCLTGSYPALCRHELLSADEVVRARKAEQSAARSVTARSSAQRRTFKGRSGCEAGHWVDSVMDDGKIVKLEDGSVWEVDAVDAIDSMLWLPTTDVIVCDGKLINTDDNEKVDAIRIR